VTDNPPNNSNTPSRRRNWRDQPAGAHRGRGNFSDSNSTDDNVAKPPSMMRSRVQLASTYAPGVLFTWEGAKGICRSVPIEKEVSPIDEATRLLIFDGIREITRNWFDRASTIRPREELPIRLILDDQFYDNGTEEIEPNRAKFQLNEPSVMGYVPYPLLYRCATCGHLEEFQSIDDQAEHPLPRACNGHEARWTQVDVVYVHWSGRIEPLSPYRYYYDDNRQRVTRIMHCKCGSEDFILDNDSPVFSEWRFICEGCRTPRELIQPDFLTYEVLQNIRRGGGRTFEGIEVNMLPVSYRANSAYYPQKSTFIEFSDRSVVDLLLPDDHRREQLLLRVAQLHGFEFNIPSNDEIQAALTTANRINEWTDYIELLELSERTAQRGNQSRAAKLQEDADSIREQWFKDGIVLRGNVRSSSLRSGVSARNLWARRYDPLRLTIEHDRFYTEHIVQKYSRYEAVNVMNPDRLICDAVGNNEALEAYQSSTQRMLTAIGIDELDLIRGLPICEYSFGFTRVSSTPIYNREFGGRQVPMPVRLNAFPILPSGNHPIYVTRQKNEALYFKLNEDRVRRWLIANGIEDVPNAGDQSIGAAYLERYEDFSQFLDDFTGREGRGGTQRTLCSYIYLLLHTLSHQIMHSLADASGLDRDGLGEHIFPADLAFCVYRKGMTPDLGNISAMWRNHSSNFLRRILDPRQLRCGSGSLCDSRGGACPACIMVSEVTCIAGNHLLSRACLRGGAAPNWEPLEARNLVGFFDIEVQ
jgi:hypothetical protein